MNHTVRRAATAAAVVAASVLTAHGAGAASGEVTKLVIYSPRPANITDEIIPMFEEAYPQYDVELLTAGGQEVADRVRAEGENPQADVWWGGTPPQFEAAAAEGLVTPFPAEILERIPEEYHGTDGAWVAEQRQLQLIAYNHDMLGEDDAPTSWADLVLPEYSDNILIRDVAASGTMRSVFASLIYQHYEADGAPDGGYDYLLQLDANTKDYAANPQDLYLRLQRQEAALPIWTHQDILAQTALGAPFSIIVPEEGAPINLDGIAKVAGGPNSEGADAFADFIFTEETQAWLAANAFQIPTLPIEETPEWLAEIEIVELPVDRAVLAEMEPVWTEYWLENIKNQG